MMKKRLFHRAAGFSIVEIVIVIAIIGILATISVVAYNGVQQRAREASVASALTQAKKQLGVYQLNNGGLPATLTSIGIDGKDVVLEYTRDTTATPNTYCLTGSLRDVTQYISATITPTNGKCAGHTGGSSGTPTPTPSPYTEDWTGADGVAWSSKWVTATSGVSQTGADIQSNKGRLLGLANANAWSRALYTAGTDTTVQGYTVDVKINNMDTYANGVIYLSIAGSTGTDVPTTGYTLEIAIGTGNIGGYNITRYNSGRTNGYYSSAASDTTNLTEFSVKFERTSANLTRFKVWAVGAAEPSTWLGSWTDATALPAGKPLISVRSQSTIGISVSFDNFILYTP